MENASGPPTLPAVRPSLVRNVVEAEPEAARSFGTREEIFRNRKLRGGKRGGDSTEERTTRERGRDAVRLTQLGGVLIGSIGVRRLEFCGGCFEAGGGADIAPIESIGTKRKDSFVCGGEEEISGDD